MGLQYLVVPVTGFEQNCTLLWCEKTRKAVVIDPGGDVPRIRKAIADRQLELERILVTHGHVDHAGGAADLARATGVPIWGPHEADSFWIEAMERQSQMFGLPGARPFTPERWLAEGDRIAFGEVTLEVLHCPGHTPGHVVFFDPVARLAQVGDVLFRGSIGRTDFPGGDHDTLIDSIHGKLWPLGDDVAFVSGHGPMSTIGEERRSNPFVRALVA
jgi:glyoxylase-like metal-dependent hydrolase (beta-lactamase superfamily II)